MQSIDLTGRNGSSGAITIYHTAADFGRYFFGGALLTHSPGHFPPSHRPAGSHPSSRLGKSIQGEALNPLILINTTYFILPPLPLPIAKGTFETTDPRKHPEQNIHT